MVPLYFVVLGVFAGFVTGAVVEFLDQRHQVQCAHDEVDWLNEEVDDEFEC